MAWKPHLMILTTLLCSQEWVKLTTNYDTKYDTNYNPLLLTGVCRSGNDNNYLKDQVLNPNYI